GGGGLCGGAEGGKDGRGGGGRGGGSKKTWAGPPPSPPPPARGGGGGADRVRCSFEYTSAEVAGYSGEPNPGVLAGGSGHLGNYVWRRAEPFSGLWHWWFPLPRIVMVLQRARARRGTWSLRHKSTW